MGSSRISLFNFVSADGKRRRAFPSIVGNLLRQPTAALSVLSEDERGPCDGSCL